MELIINKKTLQVESNSTIDAIEFQKDSYQEIEDLKKLFSKENLKRIELNGKDYFNSTLSTIVTNEVGNKIRAIFYLTTESKIDACLRRLSDLEEALAEGESNVL